MESCLWRRISPVTIKCDPGYKMVGSQNISCSEKKSRSLDVPKCEKVNNIQ